jgi:hypothetical protein
MDGTKLDGAVRIVEDGGILYPVFRMGYINKDFGISL